RATDSIVHSTVEYLAPAKLMMRISGGIVSKQNNILEDPNKLVNLSIQMLVVFPQISGFYHGDYMGDFLSITPVPPGSNYPFNAQQKLPESAHYDIRIVSRLLASATSEYHEFKDKDGITVTVEQRPLASDYYDPRIRPWFNAAVAAKKPIWSDPY